MKRELGKETSQLISKQLQSGKFESQDYQTLGGAFILLQFSLHPSFLDVFLMTSHMTLSSASLVEVGCQLTYHCKNLPLLSYIIFQLMKCRKLLNIISFDEIKYRTYLWNVVNGAIHQFKGHMIKSCVNLRKLINL